MNTSNLRISRTTESWILTWLFVLTQITFLSQVIQDVITLVVYGFICLVISSRLPRFIYVAFKDIFSAFLFLLACASFFWSENPLKTLLELRHLVCMAFFGLYLAVEYTPRDIIRLLTRLCIIMMILSLASVLLLPSYSLHVVNDVLSWRGIFDHKQTFGPFMGMSCSIFLVNCLDKNNNRWFALSSLAFAIVLMLLSNSKTGLLIFVISLYFMPLYKIIKQGKHRDFMLLIILTIYIGICVLGVVNFETIVVDDLGKDLEFNGRVPIWQLAINSGLNRPWLGYGYNGFWTSNVSYPIIKNTWAFSSEAFRDGTAIFIAHNGFVDLFLQLGIIGLTLFLINLFMLFKRIIFLKIVTRKIEFFWFFVFLVIYIINILQGSLPLSKDMFWAIYMGINFSSALEYSGFKRSQKKSKLII